MYGWFFAFLGYGILSKICEKACYPGLGALVFFAPWITFTILANSLYHERVKKKIADAQLTIKDESKLLEFLRHRGGVHTWVIWTIGIIWIIGIAAAIIIPQFAEHKQKVEIDPWSEKGKNPPVDPDAVKGKSTLFQPTEEDFHLATIRRAHPDFEYWRDSGKISEWIQAKPEPQRSALIKIYNEGSSQEVIDLITLFKQDSINSGGRL
jgi:hypothetical protein